MKLMVGNSLYVQKIDLEFLKYYYRVLPESISTKVFDNPKIDLDDYSKYDFLEFSDYEDIEYFQNVDAIIDYNMIEGYTNSELSAIGKRFSEEFDKVSSELYSITESDPKYNDVLSRHKTLTYKMKTLNDILDFRNGMLKLQLPTEKKESKFKQLINRIIPKNH